MWPMLKYNLKNKPVGLDSRRVERIIISPPHTKYIPSRLVTETMFIASHMMMLMLLVEILDNEWITLTMNKMFVLSSY